jgi:hypothetical protein
MLPLLLQKKLDISWRVPISATGGNAAPMESGATVFIGISSGDVTRKCTFVETSQGVVVEQLLESGVLSAAPRVEGPPRENPGRYT